MFLIPPITMYVYTYKSYFYVYVQFTFLYEPNDTVSYFVWAL